MWLAYLHIFKRTPKNMEGTTTTNLKRKVVEEAEKGPLDGLVAGGKYVIGISAFEDTTESMRLFFIPQQTWIDRLQVLFETATSVCPGHQTKCCNRKKRCPCESASVSLESVLKELCFPKEDKQEDDQTEEIEDEEEGKEGPSRLKRINSKKSEVVYALLENEMSISKVARLNNIQIAEVVVLRVSEEFSMPSDDQ